MSLPCIDRWESQLRPLVLSAASRLQAKHWLTSESLFAARIPGESTALVIHSTGDAPRPGDILRESIRDTFPLCLFHRRADVGALVLGQPIWGSFLAQTGRRMLPIFDEQVRHLTSVVPVLSSNPTRLDEATTLAPICASGANIAFVGPKVLCLGVTIERAVFNAELFEKCSQSYALASMTGEPLSTIPSLVRWIAGGRLKRDQRRAAKAYGDGKLPTGLNAY